MFSFITNCIEVAVGIVVADVVMSEKGQQVIKATCDKVVHDVGYAYGYVQSKVVKS